MCRARRKAGTAKAVGYTIGSTETNDRPPQPSRRADEAMPLDCGD